MASASPTTFEKYQGSPPEIYEQHFVPSIGVPFAREVLDSARLVEGERVLDLACGTGVAARMAAEQVGPTGTVAGVDLNPAMVAVARTIDPDGAPVTWHEAPAENLPLPDGSVDVVICSQGFQFFGDKEGALREMRRVLVPGGRAVLGTPGPTPPAFAVLHDVLARHIGKDAASFVDAVFSFHEAHQFRDLARSVGLGDVEVRRLALPLRLDGPADFLWQYVQGTPLAAAAASLDDEARVALEQDAVASWEPYTDGDALVVDVGMLIATARNAPPDVEEER